MRSGAETGAWSKGLRSGVYRADLPERCAIEMNVMGVPTYMLNSRQDKNITQIFYEWQTPTGMAHFTFSRTGNNPFPQVQHAMYFDTLLAMFANNFNSDGILRFRFGDVLRNTGKKVDNTGCRIAIREAIWRYHTCHALWTGSFDGTEDTWSGSFILHSSFIEDTAKKFVRNPRNTLATDTWHTVQFHPFIVKAMAAGKVRLLYSQMLSCGLPHDAYIVYRYFRRFTDRQEIRRSIEQIKSAVNYQSRTSRFKIWLDKRLGELKDAGYVQQYSIQDSWMSVTLAPVKSKSNHEKFISWAEGFNM